MPLAGPGALVMAKPEIRGGSRPSDSHSILERLREISPFGRDDIVEQSDDGVI